MLNPRTFLEALQKNGIHFFTGVPDSGLKHFCACLSEKLPPDHHIISANEGSAIGLAAGHYLSTGHIPLVYMQNSGFGNALNPLLSLADRRLYGIPMVLIIGWRGMPGANDEPQHTRMGAVQESFLDLISMPYQILPENEKESAAGIAEIIKSARRNSGPAALLVKRGTFGSYFHSDRKNEWQISRKSAINRLLSVANKNDLIISTTGYISRELHQCRQDTNKNHQNDFLNVGAMGHTSQIALGVALGQKNRRVICLDGDGSFLMHMGGAATAGAGDFPNYYHILMNNAMHESVGGQSTTGKITNFSKVAEGCGYRRSYSCSRVNNLESKLNTLLRSRGPSFLELRTSESEGPPPQRPQSTPQERKINFMNTVLAKKEQLTRISHPESSGLRNKSLGEKHGFSNIH